MIGLSGASFLLAAAVLWLTRRGRVPSGRWFGWLGLAVLPAPFLANSAGWVFTEMGRQPWVVAPNPSGVDQLHLLVHAAVSRHELATVITSLTIFTLLYGVLAILWLNLLRRYVIAGSASHSAVPPDPAEADSGTPHHLSFAY
jgi:cytochrome d ubiquinol oxidase subunit I